MKKLAILLFATMTLLSCKKETEKTESTNLQETKSTTLDLGCYIFNDGENNVSLEITENGKEIIGNLIYAYAEKDKNSGSFSGMLTDDVLLGTYIFESEGKESTREVAFKVDGDKLIEGYGDLNPDGRTFKDKTHLNFDSKMPLTKTDCIK